MRESVISTIDACRIESDALGDLPIPHHVYWGIHTERARINFPLTGRTWPLAFLKALAEVKLSCARTNGRLGFLEPRQLEAIEFACADIIAGRHTDQFPLDPLQGGAGPSTNMNLNEVIANLGLEHLGFEKGDYEHLHPFHHINLHQSTNDVFPTAIKVATLHLLKELETETAHLQEALQDKEQTFRDVVKLGRTELQDAVPMTLGMEFGAWAEALARDRWRVFKSRERIKVVNLGGTAIGTGLGAPRDYILRVVDVLREVTGLSVARAENLVDATQNHDAFVEVSGMLRALGVNLFKISSDLRLLACGPDGGIGEIRLPARQSGSTIMPGKVNPVIPEAVIQAAIQVSANDSVISRCAELGQLDLNATLPLLASALLDSLSLLANACRIFREFCIVGIEANEDVCRRHLDKSLTLATILLPRLGYKGVEEIVLAARSTNRTVPEILRERGLYSDEEIDALLSPKRMYKLGYTHDDL
jgi:aspartate ammonia-lyase